MLGYDLVQYRGEFYSDGRPKLITKRIAQAMGQLEEALGYNPGSLDLPQGCHHDGSLSGGTHSKADVFDLSYDHADDKAAALIELGVVPFVRDYDWDGQGGAPHVHCLIADSEHLSAEAAAQLPDWNAHRNGLASHAPYEGHPWRADIPAFAYDPHWSRGDGKGGGGSQGAADDPFGTAAIATRASVAHETGVRVTESVDALLGKHPRFVAWKAWRDKWAAHQDEGHRLAAEGHHLSNTQEG